MKTIKTAIFTFVALLLFTSSTYAIDYNGIGGIPAYPREDNPRTESIFVYENAPGSVVNDGVVVINNTSVTKTILVYATDTTPSSDGGFACKQYVEEVTDEGTWFKLEQTEVTLEGGKNVIVPFTVTIPSNASVGEHNACVVIQEKVEADTDSGVNLYFRAAIRAMITIPGDIVKKLDIKKFEYLKTENGKNTLTLTLSNSGNVSLDTTIEIEVKDLVTSKLFFSNKSEYPILHSNDQTFNFDLENNPWGGVYKAMVTVTYDGASGQETETKDLIFVIVPSIYAMALYAASLIIIVTSTLLITGPKRRAKIGIKNSKEYIVKEGDTLNSIAKDHEVKWKLLAKMNSKNPPYDVSVGETLKIPNLKEKIEKPITPPVIEQPVIETKQPTFQTYSPENVITPASTPSAPINPSDKPLTQQTETPIEQQPPVI